MYSKFKELLVVVIHSKSTVLVSFKNAVLLQKDAAFGTVWNKNQQRVLYSYTKGKKIRER